MAALAAAPVAAPARALDVRERALALWPGLDRRKLQRTHGDPSRVARLVARRTTLPPEAIVGLLIGDAERDAD